MALSTGIFHPQFVAHFKPVIASSFLGRVLIERDSGVEPDWNPATGQFEGGGMTQLFLGAARVQKVAKTVRRENVFDSADMQTIRVQIMNDANEIPYPAGFTTWHDNDRITIVGVDPAQGEPMLIGVLAYVTGWPGSTNQLQQTFVARYNAKQALEG